MGSFSDSDIATVAVGACLVFVALMFFMWSFNKYREYVHIKRLSEGDEVPPFLPFPSRPFPPSHVVLHPLCLEHDIVGKCVHRHVLLLLLLWWLLLLVAAAVGKIGSFAGGPAFTFRSLTPFFCLAPIFQFRMQTHPQDVMSPQAPSRIQDVSGSRTPEQDVEAGGMRV
jgi:hypothetical protein